MNKAEERQAFLDRIEEDPYDSTNRLIFADWLEEFGDDKDHEEAIEQRRCSTPQWKDSREWFLHVYLPELCYNDTDYGRFGEDNPTLETLIIAAHAHLDGKIGGNICLSFDTPYIVYQSVEEFWKQFEIYTGRKLNDDYDHGTFVRCSC